MEEVIKDKIKGSPEKKQNGKDETNQSQDTITNKEPIETKDPFLKPLLEQK
ncbi:19296_t:CDS:2 [Funneliformis geosporum]|uniref:15048_t:CDS:1 n=1 Tax=Funneliformis geosporum TaxID=1117311 RepID=A0A9W4SNL0_9GLOM|nr:19296_t:CDS:2 [Funneliformis geosporum]CAI2175943.1 15048_t:CDS:2 [Funneliformis geosporum]